LEERKQKIAVLISGSGTSSCLTLTKILNFIGI
jgi:hypothetical protein